MSDSESVMEERQNVLENLINKLKDTKDENGKNSYTYLQDVLSYIAFTNPESGINKFEEILYEMRTKGDMQIPESYLNYKELALAAKPHLQAIYEQYYEVFMKSIVIG